MKWKVKLPELWHAHLASGVLAGMAVWQFYSLARDVKSWALLPSIVGLACQAFGIGWLGCSYWTMVLRKKNMKFVSSEPIPLEFLTQREIDHIESHQTCPDCAVGSLLNGPRGGCSMNMKCSNPDCRHEFNLARHMGHIVLGNRIDRDEPSLYHAPLEWEK